VIRVLLDQYHVWHDQAQVVLENAKPDISRWRKEANDGSASSDFILYLTCMWSNADISVTGDDATMHFRRAVDRGHVYASVLVSELLMEHQPAKAMDLLDYAATMKCPRALLLTAYSRATESLFATIMGVSRVLDIIDCTEIADEARWVLKQYQRDEYVGVVQYGQWMPTKTHQRCVPDLIQRAQWVWLLVAKRKKLCHYLALRVCDYIVTRSGWVKK
jgi:hypothetical protein